MSTLRCGWICPLSYFFAAGRDDALLPKPPGVWKVLMKNAVRSMSKWRNKLQVNAGHRDPVEPDAIKAVLDCGTAKINRDEAP